MGYSGMLDMNFCKMTRKPQHFCCRCEHWEHWGQKGKRSGPEMGKFWQRNARRSKGMSTYKETSCLVQGREHNSVGLELWETGYV